MIGYRRFEGWVARAASLLIAGLQRSRSHADRVLADLRALQRGEVEVVEFGGNGHDMVVSSDGASPEVATFPDEDCWEYELEEVVEPVEDWPNALRPVNFS